MKFEKMLKDWVESSNYTHESVAMALGVDPITVERWIDGARIPTPRLINRVSAVTGIQLEDLLESAGYSREQAYGMSKTPNVSISKLKKAL